MIPVSIWLKRTRFIPSNVNKRRAEISTANWEKCRNESRNKQPKLKATSLLALPTAESKVR